MLNFLLKRDIKHTQGVVKGILMWKIEYNPYANESNYKQFSRNSNFYLLSQEQLVLSRRDGLTQSVYISNCV